MSVVFETRLNLPGRRRGKVRDVYDLPSATGKAGAAILIIATDRVSAFDVVLPTPIPGKGRLLTEISTFWFRFVERQGLVKTHVISTDARHIPEAAFTPEAGPGAGAGRGAESESTWQELEGRVTIGRACRVIPIECVARGYLEGSGWKDYKASGAISGVSLPPGLKQCDRLAEPIFTPATKAPQGQHDENITFERAAKEVGPERMAWLRDKTLAIYSAAAEYALSRGIIIADTKFEFGVPIANPDAEPILIDEVLTPDSSRFWPADRYEPGRAQPSFDKQYLREYLQGLADRGEWDKSDPGPELPLEVIERTLAKYVEARDRLVG